MLSAGNLPASLQAVESNMAAPEDEKLSKITTPDTEGVRSIRLKAKQLRDRVNHFFTAWGIETNGIDPVPPAERTDNKLYQIFFVWFSVNMNIPTFGIGSVGPAFYGLGLRESLITILIVDLTTCTIPAYL